MNHLTKSVTALFFLSASLLFSCQPAFSSSLSSSVSETPVSSASDSSLSSLSSEEPVTITEEEKTKPSSSPLVYDDYGDGRENYDTGIWHRNDLTDLGLADPFVLADQDGTYYLFGTTDRTSATTFDCYVTTDFVNFELHPDVFNPKTGSGWIKDALFAPECYRFDNTYYLYYSANDLSGNRHLGLATSSSPTGPYVDYQGYDADGQAVDYFKNGFLTDNRNSSGIDLAPLDQTLLVDDDGSIYLYYSIYDNAITNSQYIVGMAMKDPVTPDFTTYQKLLVPAIASPDLPQASVYEKYFWEIYSTNLKVAEGPCVVKSPVNGKYYLTYSVNHFPDMYYSVDYAVSDTPLGSYTKPYTKGNYWTNLLFGYGGGMKGTTVYDQWVGFMAGTAHHSIFKAGKEYFIVYHAIQNRLVSDFNYRRVAFDHLYWDASTGDPYTHGPTWSLEPLPEIATGYHNLVSEARVGSENVTGEEKVTDNRICEHYNLKQETDAEFTLGAGKSYIKLKFDKPKTIAAINVYNSSFYDKKEDKIDYILLGDGNSILDASFPQRYLNETKKFIYPDSAFSFNFPEIETDTIVFAFDNLSAVNLNEIAVYGF